VENSTAGIQRLPRWRVPDMVRMPRNNAWTTAARAQQERPMNGRDLPEQITCLCRGTDGSPLMHTLYLRADEREHAWVYATPRQQAIDGVDLITVCIPRE
jgi:hypothetical protein